MIAFLGPGLQIVAGLAAILGRTVDSRDDAQSLWPFERAQPNASMPPPGLRTCDLHGNRPDAALRPTHRRSS